MYENRTFNLDSVTEVDWNPKGQCIRRRKRHIKHHRYDLHEMYEHYTEKAIAELNAETGEQRAAATFETYHILGVFMFLFVTCIGHTINYWYTLDGHGNSYQHTAWCISIFAIFPGLIFLWLNQVLLYDDQQEQFEVEEN